MTCTMIGAWLTELHLHERGQQMLTAATGQSSDASGKGSRAAGKSQTPEDRQLLAKFLNSIRENVIFR